MNEAGVAVLPGAASGGDGGGHPRLSHVNSAANLRVAVAAIDVMVMAM